MSKLDEWLTVADAAKLAKRHPEHIRLLVRQKKVVGRKWATVWQVSRASLEAYLASVEQQGEKRGPRPE